MGRARRLGLRLGGGGSPRGAAFVATDVIEVALGGGRVFGRGADGEGESEGGGAVQVAEDGGGEGGGEAGAVFLGVADVHEGELGLDGGHGMRIVEAGVDADYVAAAKKLGVANAGEIGRGPGGETGVGEKGAKAVGAAHEKGKRKVGAGDGEGAQGAEGDEFRVVERVIVLVEFLATEGVAKLDAGDGVAVTMDVHEEAATVVGDDGGSGGGDEAVELVPGLFGERIALGGLLDGAVDVELEAVEVAEDEMGAAAGEEGYLLGGGDGDLAGVAVGPARAVGAVANLVGGEVAAVSGDEDEREVAGPVFDVALAAEERFAGLVGASEGCREEQEREDGEAAS